MTTEQDELAGNDNSDTNDGPGIQPSGEARMVDTIDRVAVVTVFGAGIAGLTVAHELVERGFRVQVVEPAESLIDEGCCEVGGVAATQWSFLTNPEISPQGARPGQGEPLDLASVFDSLGIAAAPAAAVDAAAASELNGEDDTDPVAHAASKAAEGGAKTAVDPGLFASLFASAVSAAALTAMTQGKKLRALMPAPFVPYRVYFQIVKNAAGKWEPRPYDQNHALLPGDKPFRLERVQNWARLGLLAAGLDRFRRSDPLQPDPAKPPVHPYKVYVVGYTEHTVLEADARDWSKEWATQVARRLERLLEAAPYNCSPIAQYFTFEPIGLGSAEPIGDNAFEEGRARNNRVELRVAGESVPGDHGYRFFPSFYRNLDDTMRRTPLYDDKGNETGETALERLRSTNEVSIAMADGAASFRLPRRRMKSFEEMRLFLTDMLRRFDYPPKDVALFQLQLFRLLTMSSQRRRRELDGISWLNFMSGKDPAAPRLVDSNDNDVNTTVCPRCKRQVCHHHQLPFSDDFLKDLDKFPQAMAGMRGRESDAHTNGAITLQMMFDQFGDGSNADRLLVGPTSPIWLAHWKSYLRRQGVRFFVGRLDSLKPDDVTNPTRIDPVAVGVLRGTPLPPDFPPYPEPNFADDAASGKSVDSSDSYDYEETADYYVSALPVDAFRKMLRTAFPKGAPPLQSPLEQIRQFDVGDAFDTPREGPPSALVPFRDVTGIQFFFTNDFHLAEGHTYHADSAWRLTSVTQLQFWRRRRTVKSGYLGIVSVDIGEMHRGDTSLCTKREFKLDAELRSIEARIKQTPNPAIEAVWRLASETHGRVQEFEPLFRDWVSGLSDATSAVPTAWETTTRLATAIDARMGLVRKAIDDLLGQLAVPAKPTAPQLAELRARIAVAVGTAPGVLPSDAKIWKPWKDALESLIPIFEAITATDVAQQGPVARRVVDRIVKVLQSLAHVPFAWQCSHRELAKSAWRQIEVALQQHVRGSIPKPDYYHIDSGIEFDFRPGTGGKAVPCRNNTPFFINAVGGFDARPGVLPGQDDEHPFYEVAYGQWLPVGGVMKSYTRITSMEHANESGRHVVRAILHDLIANPKSGKGRMFGTMPKYWNPEDHELDDLAFLKRLDSILFDDNLPHMVDILGLEELVVRWMAGNGAESLDNFAELLSAVRYQRDRDFGPWIDSAEKSLEPLRKLVEAFTRIGVQSSVR